MKRIKYLPLMVVVAGFTFVGAGCERENPMQGSQEERSADQNRDQRSEPGGTPGQTPSMPQTPQRTQ